MNKSFTIAVFDLDGTITNKDTFIEFIKYCKGHTKFYLGLMLLIPHIVLFYIKFHTNSKLKEIFFTYYFKGQSNVYMKKKGREFSINILPKLCRKDALDILNWHTTQGHKIMILTASSDIWLKEWCALNSFELICTEFQVEENKYTGLLQGENCYGIQKKKLLLEIFIKNNYTYSFGYGDSKADKYFLELVNQPYLMKLDKKNVAKYWSPNIKI